MKKFLFTFSTFPARIHYILLLAGGHLTFSIGFCQLPDTDIWLLNMKKKDSTYLVSDPVNITNRLGYDNQPCFHPDGSYLLYTSVREDGQADIYKFDIKTKTTTPFCKTPESEYSPTFTPERKFVSVVRVEKDSAQRLWKFPIAGGDPILLTKDIDSIGYHCWLNPDSLVFFILTQPFTLQLASLSSQKTTVISDSIGKSLVRFRYMRSAGALFIRSVRGKNMVCFTTLQMSKKNKFYVEEIMPLPEGCEYFCFYNNTLFCAKGGKVFKSEMMKDNTWILLGDLSTNGITNITRLAVSPDGQRIAIVNSK